MPQKIRIDLPSWEVEPYIENYTGSVVSQKYQENRYLDFSDIADSTSFKGKKHVKKAKRNSKISNLEKWLKRVQNTIKGLPNRARIRPKSTSPNNKVVEKRLTRKSKQIKTYEPGIRLYKGVGAKIVALTNSVDHFQARCYPSIVGNSYRRVVSSKYDFFSDFKHAYVDYNHMCYFDLRTLKDDLQRRLIYVVNKHELDGIVLQHIVKNALPRPENFFPCVNVIAMLVELKATLNIAKDTMSMFLNAQKNLLKRENGVAGAIDSAAESRLWWNFGVSPTASDIASLLGLLMSFRDYIDIYNKKAGKIYTIHRTIYKDNISRDDMSINREFLEPYNVFGTGIYPEGHYIEPYNADSGFGNIVGRFTLKIKLKPLPISWYARIFEHCLGFDAVVAGLWEGVPFSWLIDYFVNTADLIDYYTSTDLILPYEIVDASLSYSAQGTHEFVRVRHMTAREVRSPRNYMKGGKVYIAFNELLQPKMDWPVKGSLLCEYKAYRRRNVTALADMLARAKSFDPLWPTMKRPKPGQAANALAVGWLIKRGKAQRR